MCWAIARSLSRLQRGCSIAALNGTALILLGATQSVIAVRAPGEPQGIREGPVNDFDRDIFDSKLLPGCGKPMVPVD